MTVRKNDCGVNANPFLQFAMFSFFILEINKVKLVPNIEMYTGSENML